MTQPPIAALSRSPSSLLPDGRAVAAKKKPKKSRKPKKPASIRWLLIPVIDWTDAAAVQSARSELRELFDRVLAFGRSVDSSKHQFGDAWRAIVEKDMAIVREARANLFGRLPLEVVWALLRIAELSVKAHEFEINALGKKAKGRLQGKKGAEGRTAITERGVAKLEAFFIERGQDINKLKTRNNIAKEMEEAAAKELRVTTRTIYNYVTAKFPELKRQRRRAPSSVASQNKFGNIVRKIR